MSLVAGARLGPYEIQSAIGAGGMGEVYKARDTRLDRTVAIKVLPPDVSGDFERRARFEREAKTIAGLNHPHICVLHDVGDHDGSVFLVMEHIVGQTLAERLEKGALPLEHALNVGAEIAEGLAAAHRQGIIHRDLKPANVMLAKEGSRRGPGQVKLLDFGLAKLLEPDVQQASHGDAEPTRSASLTGPAELVGTLPYMAPEQLDRKAADARTDLWALGVMLHEMVTGRRPFEGETAVSLAAAILDRDPPGVSSVQPLAAPSLDRLIHRCLAKSPDDRPDTAHDVATDLRWIQESDASAKATHATKRRSPLSAALIGLACALAGAATLWLLQPRPGPALSVHSLLAVSPAEELNGGYVTASSVSLTPGGSRTALAWTPDGRALIFVGRRDGVQQLYERRLDEAEANPVPGTEGAQMPAVSPDGEWVAFWANGVLRKASLRDERIVSDLKRGMALPMYGHVWNTTGGLVGGGASIGLLMLTPERKVRVFTNLDPAFAQQLLPFLLPGERRIIYTARRGVRTWHGEQIVGQNLDTGERKVVVTDGADGRYLPTGHLVFLRRGKLFAVAFDPERLEPLGKEEPVLNDVAQALTGTVVQDATGAGHYAISATGTIAWVSRPIVERPLGNLVSVDLSGNISQLPAGPRNYAPPLRVSPEGLLAVTIREIGDARLWLYDVQRGGTSPLPMNHDGESVCPVWLQGGRRLAFSWNVKGRDWLGAQTVDGSRAVTLIQDSFFPASFAPDGRSVVGVRWEQPENPEDVELPRLYGYVAVARIEEGEVEVLPLIRSDGAMDMSPDLSPDGRWLAYQSNRSGSYEVYVRREPFTGRDEPVSVDGGVSPAWHPNGRSLFFLGLADASGRRSMMVADFEPGSPPRIGKPRPLFDFGPELEFACGTFFVRCYDLDGGGQRFYVVQTPLPNLPPVTHINLIQNWFEKLNAKVPPPR